MDSNHNHNKKIICLFSILCVFLIFGIVRKCANNVEEQEIRYFAWKSDKENIKQTKDEVEKAIYNQDDIGDEREYPTVEKADRRIPALMQYDPEILTYDPEDTIYYKTYYDDFFQGKIMYIDYNPYMEIRKELEDYFVDDSKVFYLDYLVSMFYDDRTIETDEKKLEQLFWEHGYIIYFHSVEFQDFHLRFIEIVEKEGLSLYPIRILMQTWDDDYIYLQDITGPIPRKIRDMMVGDKNGVWKLIVHSSGFSKEYIPEEELSFWEFTGSDWILVPMELEIDTSHAFSLGNLYPDIDRNELFETFYYRDGIAFRPSSQPDNEYGTNNTYRLGIMEITEENKSFRLVTIYDVEGISRSSLSYIQFIIIE